MLMIHCHKAFSLYTNESLVDTEKIMNGGTDVNEASQFVDSALEQWRKNRDELFEKHGLNQDEVYSNGDFENLPTECLIAVCYVDAYACVQAKIRSESV